MRDLSKYNVLMVDDVPVNLLLVSKMLAPYNFRVRLAGNGQEALEMVARKIPDLILLDMLMPGMDGFEVLRRLKANPAWAGIRVIVLSALNSNEDIVRAYGLGAKDFITKPILMEKLIHSVDLQLQELELGRKDLANK